MWDTYYESAEGLVISKERAIQELRKHSIVDPAEFFAEMGERESYEAQSVLDWLGY